MNLKLLIAKAKQPRIFVAIVSTIVGLMVIKHRLDSRPAVNEIEVKWQKQHISSIDSTGQIRAGRESFMILRKGGRLDEIKIGEGQSVKKGDIILVVDLANNRANLERALSKYKFASQEYGRNRNLLAAAAGTRQAFEETQNFLTVAKSDLEEARQKLEDSMVRAPSDGMVTLIAFQVGDFIPDGSRVAIVEDHSHYEIVARIPIEREDELPKETEISLTSTRLGGNKEPKKVEAKVESLAALSSMVSQDFDARLRFEKLPEGIKVKEQVRVTIPLQTFKNVSMVKLQSVFDIQAEPKVMILNQDNHPVWKTVEIVDVVQDKVFLKGLKKDMKVVVPDEGTQIPQILGKKVVIHSLEQRKG